ncbi:MAG: TonB-dependent receptor [Candidatus Kapabacteria bacterium]|jgi:outer membrane receptor for ferrienterochelin and colicin|nr:TonB-dependent receptor [Candidatus Kapabacteria bacterium]
MILRSIAIYIGCGLAFVLAPASIEARQDSTQVSDTASKEALKNLLDNYLDLSAVSSVDVGGVSRTQQTSAKNAPATVITITAEQIRLRGYTSLTDVLMDLPDYKIEGLAGQESVNRVNVRGVFGQDKFIVLLDGVRISSPTNEFMPLLENYPVHLALQIEVIYGPASSLYGADAVMGVINIVSKRSFDMDGAVEVQASGSMYNRFNGNILAGFKLNEQVNIMFGAQYMTDQFPDLRQFYPDDYGRENTLQTGVFPTAFGTMRPQKPIKQQWASPMTANAQWLKVEAGGLTINLLRSHARATTNWGYPQSNAVYNDDVFFAPTITMLSGTYQTTIDRTTLISSLVYSQYDLDPLSNYRNLFNDLGPGYKYAFGSMFKAEQLVQHTLLDNLTLSGSITAESFMSVPKTTDMVNPQVTSVGLNYLEGRIFGTINAQNPLGISADIFKIPYINIGGFAQAQWLPVPQVTVTVGGRYDANSLFGTSFNPRVGVVWSPSRQFTAKAMYGTAYLGAAPRYAYEQFGAFSYDSVNNTYSSGFWKLANPNLKPISSQTAELNVSTFLSDDLSLTASGFFTTLTGLFREVSDATSLNIYNGRYKGYPVSTIIIFINQGRQYTYGATLNASYIALRNQTAKLEFFGALSWIDGAVSITDNNADFRETPYVSPFAFKGGVQVTFEKFNLSARVIWQDRQRTAAFQAARPERRQTIDGFTLVNLTARYGFASWLEAFVRIDNALDSRYRGVTDLTNPEAVGRPNASEIEFLRGVPQLPFRATAGVQLTIGGQ